LKRPEKLAIFCWFTPFVAHFDTDVFNPLG
jgi:hypothetical protein